MDLEIETLTHDLLLDGTDLALVDGVDAIAQHLRIRYLFFLGEWFLDTRLGIPYYEKILVKAPVFADVNSILRQVATDTPGIADVDRFDSAFDPTTRELTIDLWARSDDGEPIQFSEPFIIGGAAQ